MPDSNTTAGGAGPFTFESPALSPGEAWRVELTNQPRYHRYVPFDSVLIKNYDDANRIDAEFNGRSGPRVDVDPNGKDTYSEVPIRLFRVINQGGTEIPAESVTVTLKRDPYDADDAAREQASRGLAERIVRGQLGL